jgi:methylmalonyl-CoA mutase N-terminal domain/subunit
LLAKGQAGLSVAFDLPTQMGFDSDHPRARGEVGKVGVAICSLDDMETLFDGIPLARVSTSMTINATAAILLALYAAVARRQGASLNELSGTVQNDILKEYIARGTYIYPPGPAMRIITDLFAWCRTEMPRWTTISISGYHIREAGSTAAQEVAFTFADAIAYVEAAIAAGLEVDEFAPRLSFFFNAHSDLLEELAKYRAARRLWAHIMRERFGARDPRSLMLRFHAQTAGSSLTAQQPNNNIVRVAVQALAAVLGGCQSLHTNALDEALALPTEDAALLALRTQQILAHETGVANTVDPVGGAYAIEWLTDQIERQASAIIARIDVLGGTLRAIETGYIQREIQNAAYDYQQKVERGERVVVGVNRFRAAEQTPIPTLRIDPGIEREQVERLHALRARRDAAGAEGALAAVESRARTGENLMPAILSAVEAHATVGEISDALRRVFGEYQETVSL